MHKTHDGTKYIAFCRMERTDGEAVEFLNTLTFEGQKLMSRVNVIESRIAVVDEDTREPKQKTDLEGRRPNTSKSHLEVP